MLVTEKMGRQLLLKTEQKIELQHVSQKEEEFETADGPQFEIQCHSLCHEHNTQFFFLI